MENHVVPFLVGTPTGQGARAGASIAFLCGLANLVDAPWGFGRWCCGATGRGDALITLEDWEGQVVWRWPLTRAVADILLAFGVALAAARCQKSAKGRDNVAFNLARGVGRVQRVWKKWLPPSGVPVACASCGWFFSSGDGTDQCLGVRTSVSLCSLVGS
ncbi:hypothetical protein, unlikely [Trypanosoma brucei gambiense DAL972]|uniref:Uncharacterized protein n=1 Tax=Trypanosoma brucei gambiense (strain MHOM/CI/86/DAL972) TaxID=679716 RepID=C9ZQ46_TRYB9|nr:hypothetical protein, unlikely [Trypanosoma brucei gambiense DAL972]CBH11526.1 hypothetical protein, unlikely [Trypanosoma brucei gambiense DAL972]|eukprot:XP_011773811.1 hypothetical protein, unlikely [Trypanosoma brucei gambiense DAL972]